MKPGLAFMMTLASIAAGTLETTGRATRDGDQLDPPPPPPEAPRWGQRGSAASARRERVQRLHASTGWVFAKCRELVDKHSDAEIDALVRERFTR